ncbi:4-(cytidine 5'-diphospho)-2-C-methyl-D-erythritol kinase [Algivirga pacifica]|uniref:4-diphosphocytidyl-2-C-methyl-D-erythritol kinase n=1 Tax=Algivirga pacifica TaxID=1162670 RepID=A0ABP9DC53_9BACT
MSHPLANSYMEGSCFPTFLTLFFQQKMILFPNAKINLGLNVLYKRPDGFHALQSCFYPVGWADVLEITEAESYKFTSTGIEIPGDPSNNLCTKAYDLLKKDFDIPAVHIHLHKIVPIGAGLGGGSADGAFTLKGLNDLFGLGLSIKKLQTYAEQLGSDCPFFIENKPVWVTGRGEVFEPVELDLSGKYIVLANPGIHISTAEAYGAITPQEPTRNTKKELEGDIAHWKAFVKNDFEEPIAKKYVAIQNLKEYMYQKGAVYASMTGSGSTVFGIFDEKPLGLSFEKEIMTWEGTL